MPALIVKRQRRYIPLLPKDQVRKDMPALIVKRPKGGTSLSCPMDQVKKHDFIIILKRLRQFQRTSPGWIGYP